MSAVIQPGMNRYILNYECGLEQSIEVKSVTAKRTSVSLTFVELKALGAGKTFCPQATKM